MLVLVLVLPDCTLAGCVGLAGCQAAQPKLCLLGHGAAYGTVHHMRSVGLSDRTQHGCKEVPLVLRLGCRLLRHRSADFSVMLAVPV